MTYAIETRAETTKTKHLLRTTEMRILRCITLATHYEIECATRIFVTPVRYRISCDGKESMGQEKSVEGPCGENG